MRLFKCCFCRPATQTREIEIEAEDEADLTQKIACQEQDVIPGKWQTWPKYSIQKCVEIQELYLIERKDEDEDHNQGQAAFDFVQPSGSEPAE